MTIALRPVPDPSGSEAASNDHASCGLRAAASIIRAHGVTPTLKIPDGATATDIANGVNAFGNGFHAAVAVGDIELLAGAAVARGRDAIVGVNCTGNAEPTTAVTGIRHWLVQFGTDGECFNDWLQTFPTYLPAMLSAAHNPGMGTVTIWRDPPPPPPEAPDPMWMARTPVLLPNGRDGYQLDAWGGIHPIGTAVPAKGAPYWPGWSIARDIAINPDGSGGLLLDGFGGLHPFACEGAAPPQPQGVAYWHGWDIVGHLVVTRWDVPAGYTFDDWGGSHPFGGAPPMTGGCYFRNNVIG